jgi:hypothetical protein
LVAKKASDLDKILLHYLAVLNPYIQVSWKNPANPKEELITKVTWDGSSSFESPEQPGDSEKIRYIATMGLTVESWAFRKDEERVGQICGIQFNTHILDECVCDLILADDDQNEGFIVDACPVVHNVEPHCVDAGKFVNVYGRNLSQIESIYALPLSGADIPLSSWEPFCFSESLSGSCPSFSGYVFDEYKVLDHNTISVKVPEDWVEDTCFDLLVTNRYCGCSKLSDSKSECAVKKVTVI